MPSIAQAVVTVRPDLTGFAAQLRADLRKQLDAVGKEARTVTIYASLGPTAQAKAALQAQLSKLTGLTVEVTPVLNKAGVASFQKQLGIVPIEVGLAGGQAQKIRRQIATSAATAGGVAGTATQSSVNITGQEARTAQATENLTRAQLDLNKALAAEQVDLEKVTIAQAKLLSTETALIAETEKLALVRQKAAAPQLTQRQQDAAAATQARNQLRAETLAAREQAGVLLAGASANLGAIKAPPTSAKEAAASIAIAEKAAADAAEAEAIAIERGTKALLTKATATRQLAESTAVQLEETQKNLRLDEARIPVLHEIEVIQQRIAAATNKDLSAIAQRTRLIGVENQLTVATQKYSIAVGNANADDLANLRTLGLKIDALKAERTVLIENSAAQARQAITQGQVIKGASATGATFLGLRGAVLSASGGFLAATIAITGLAKIIGTAGQLQQGLNVFQSVSGATAEQMAAVDAEAKKLGADLTLPATSANDAASAMTELARAGLSVADSIAAARGVLQLSAAANISVADSANIVATELNAFGLSGKEATHVADLLAGAAKAAQGNITDFGLAFQQVSAVAHQVRLPIEDTTAVLTQFAKAGLHGSDAGTSLRTMLLRLVPTTKTATDAQAALGIHINKNIPIGQQFLDLIDQYTAALQKLGPIAQQEALTKIFGQDAIRGASIVLTQGSANLVATQQAVDVAGTAADQAAARMKGLLGAIEGIKSEIQTLAATIGTVLLPPLETAVRDLSAVAQTADQAVTAVKKLANIGVGPVTGGSILKELSGPAVTAGLAVGIGAGISKLVTTIRNAGKEAATVATESAATVTAAAAEEAAAITAAAAEGATAQEAAAAAGAEAYVTSSGIIISASAAQTAAIVADAAAAKAAQSAVVPGIPGPAGGAGLPPVIPGGKTGLFKNLSIKGLGAGIALQLAGSLLQQSGFAKAGGVATAAGAGAEFGSFFGPEGALAGAAVAGGIKILQDSIAESKKKQEALKAEFQKMTPSQQRDLIATFFPNKAKGAFINDVEEMLARTTTQTVLGHQITSTASDFVASRGGLSPELQARLDSAQAERTRLFAQAQKAFPTPQITPFQQFNLPGKFPGQVEGGNIDILNRPPVKVPGKGFGTVFSISVQFDGKEVVIPQIYDGKLHSEAESIQHFLATKQSFGAFVATPNRTAIQNANDFANQLHLQQADILGNIFRSTTGIGTFVLPPDPLKTVADQFHDQNTKSSASIKLVLAQAEGNLTEEDRLLTHMVAVKQAAINTLQGRLDARVGGISFGKFVITDPATREKIRQEILKELKAFNELAALQQVDLAVFQRIANPQSLQLATIKAGATPGLADNLKVAQTSVETTAAAVEAARKKFGSKGSAGGKKITQAEQDAIDSLVRDNASAVANVTTTAASATTAAASTASTAAQTAIDNLTFIADKVGNIGPAEDKLLAALKHQVDIAKKNTPEFNKAQSAYAAEQKKHMDAVLGMAQSLASLRDARNQFALDIAKSTPGLDDDKRILRQIIAADKADIAAFQKRINAGGLTPAEINALKIQIVGKQKDVFDTLQQIKGLTGGAGGGLNLFNEGRAQFESFASNVSQHPLSPGQAGNSVFIAQFAAQLNKLKPAERLALEKASETNDLLASILDQITDQNANSPHRKAGILHHNTSGSHSPGLLTASRAALFAAVVGLGASQ